MNVRHETKQISNHLDEFCAFGVCSPSRCTQTHDFSLISARESGCR